MELFDWEAKWLQIQVKSLHPRNSKGAEWPAFVASYLKAGDDDTKEEDLQSLVDVLRDGGMIII